MREVVHHIEARDVMVFQQLGRVTLLLAEDVDQYVGDPDFRLVARPAFYDCSRPKWLKPSRGLPKGRHEERLGQGSSDVCPRAHGLGLLFLV